MVETVLVEKERFLSQFQGTVLVEKERFRSQFQGTVLMEKERFHSLFPRNRSERKRTVP